MPLLLLPYQEKHMRHKLVTMYNGHPVDVVMGFDMMLQGYFMTVEPEEENNPDADEESGMIYSNLDDPALESTMGMAPNLEHFKTKLQSMNIEVPDVFIATVLAD